MQTARASTRRAALAAFLLFAAGLFVVGPAEASRATTDARTNVAPGSSLELPTLELVEPKVPVESSPRFGFGEDLGLLDPEAGPGGFVVFARGLSRCELTYARNNPLKYVDPDGNAAVAAVAVAMARGAAVGAATSVALNGAVNYIGDRPLLEGAGREALIGAGIGAVTGGLGPLISFAKSEFTLGRAISVARASANAGTALEGQAASALGRSVKAFQKTVSSGGRVVGEIDIETTKAIVEVTAGGGRGKVAQATKLLTDAALNPTGKPVVVFGPNLSPGAALEIEKAGAKVVRTIDDLVSLAK